MKIIKQLYLNLRYRYLFVILLFLGSILLVHGVFYRLSKGAFLWEFYLGLFLSIVSILIAAIPAKSLD